MRLRLALAAVLALSVTAVAGAAFSSGTYSGFTSDGGAVSFKASQSSLSKLSVAVRFNCTDGDHVTATVAGFPAQNVRKGRYSATYTGSKGASSYVNKGRITRRTVGKKHVSTAKGTFTGSRRYDAQGHFDPRGTITCTTGTLRYSISKK